MERCPSVSEEPVLTLTPIKGSSREEEIDTDTSEKKSESVWNGSKLYESKWHWFNFGLHKFVARIAVVMLLWAKIQAQLSIFSFSYF